MKTKVSELIGQDLDILVHSIVGAEPLKDGCTAPPYSSDMSFGGDIMEDKGIGILKFRTLHAMAWRAVSFDNKTKQYGPRALVAAMRCLVASEMGDEVEVKISR
jgi:hypothetical protein